MSGVFGLVSLCLSVEPSAASPRGCPVLYLAGRLLTVSAVSPYTDEWVVSRPFPKLSFPCSNASSRGMAEKTRAPPPARRPSLRGSANAETGMEAKFKMLPSKGGRTRDGEREGDKEHKQCGGRERKKESEGEKKERQKMEGA